MPSDTLSYGNPGIEQEQFCHGRGHNMFTKNSVTFHIQYWVLTKIEGLMNRVLKKQLKENQSIF